MEETGELLPLTTPRLPAGMSFEPIPAMVDGVCRELAEGMRTLAVRLGISMTRYARDVHRDRSTLSRWLSGIAVPPADFLDRLTSDVEAATGLPLTPEARDHLHRLHRAALAERNPRSAELQSLRDRWSDADRQARDLRTEVDLLKEMLRTAQQKAAEQEQTLGQLERGTAATRLEHRAELARLTDDRDHLRAEHDRLLGLVDRLREELHEAERRQMEAEHRCDLLEHQLETAERAAERSRSEEQGPEESETARLHRRLALLEDERAAHQRELYDLRQQLRPPDQLPHDVLALYRRQIASPDDPGLLARGLQGQPAATVAALIAKCRTDPYVSEDQNPTEAAVQAVLASYLNRSPGELAKLVAELENRGLQSDSDQLLYSAAWGPTETVVEIAQRLASSPRLTTLLASAGWRPMAEIGELLTALRHAIGNPEAMLDTLAHRQSTDLIGLLVLLKESGDNGTTTFLLRRAATRAEPEVVDLILELARQELMVWAQFLAWQTTHRPPTERTAIRHLLDTAGLGSWYEQHTAWAR